MKRENGKTNAIEVVLHRIERKYAQDPLFNEVCALAVLFAAAQLIRIRGGTPTEKAARTRRIAVFILLLTAVFRIAVSIAGYVLRPMILVLFCYVVNPGGRFRAAWALAALNGVPLGWVKASDGVLKNHYPKGLRRNA